MLVCLSVCVCVSFCMYLHEKELDVTHSRLKDRFCSDGERVVSLNGRGAISFDLWVFNTSDRIAFDRMSFPRPSLFHSHSCVGVHQFDLCCTCTASNSLRWSGVPVS